MTSRDGTYVVGAHRSRFQPRHRGFLPQAAEHRQSLNSLPIDPCNADGICSLRPLTRGVLQSETTLPTNNSRNSFSRLFPSLMAAPLRLPASSRVCRSEVCHGRPRQSLSSSRSTGLFQASCLKFTPCSPRRDGQAILTEHPPLRCIDANGAGRLSQPALFTPSWRPGVSRGRVAAINSTRVDAKSFDTTRRS
jgi:hypothetical protein